MASLSTRKGGKIARKRSVIMWGNGHVGLPTLWENCLLLERFILGLLFLFQSSRVSLGTSHSRWRFREMEVIFEEELVHRDAQVHIMILGFDQQNT